MSLNAEYKKIKDWEKVVYIGDKLNPVTHGLVFMTMCLGMHALTEKNCQEFIRRMEVWQDINGGMLQSGEGPVRLTPEDVKTHIGLHTNAVSISTAKFKREMEKQAYDAMVKKREYNKNESFPATQHPRSADA